MLCPLSPHQPHCVSRRGEGVRRVFRLMTLAEHSAAQCPSSWQMPHSFAARRADCLAFLDWPADLLPLAVAALSRFSRLATLSSRVLVDLLEALLATLPPLPPRAAVAA